MISNSRTQFSATSLVAVLLLGATVVVVRSQGLTMHPQDTLMAYDAAGKRVGKVVGVDDYLRNPVVALKADDDLLMLELQFDRFLAGSLNHQGVGVAFPSTDCSGTPFLIGTGIEQLEALNRVVIPPIMLVDQLAFAPDGPIQSVVLRSHMGDPLDRDVCLELTGDAEQLTVPMRFVADLSIEFAPPFRVR